MRRILVVEDDQSMSIALHDGFVYEGYEVLVAHDGMAGLELASASDIALIILDVMLPLLSGFDLCQQLREAGNRVPIIMLTARGQEIDKVLGLKLGADDYVTKPFSFMELLARAEAVLRRSGTSQATLTQARFGDVEVDFQSLQATKGGKALSLSPREFHILHYLIEHSGQVISRNQLLDAVWGYDETPFTRTVDMHIAKLRKKIEDRPTYPRHIVTLHRVGYKFVG